MSEFDAMYREVILDHYKNPRGHGVIEDADATAEGENPLCGDEVAIYVEFADDGETIEDVKFRGRGCAISQASTSMLMEMVKGRKAREVASMPRDELLDEVGIPLTPIRLKCALLGLGVLKVALHRAKGTPLPEEWAGLDELTLTLVADVDVCPVEELPPGEMKLVHAGQISRRRLQHRRRALRDRGSLLARRRRARRGRLGAGRGVVICPRHGSQFDIRTGKALTLPAYLPVETFPVRVEDGVVKGGDRMSEREERVAKNEAVFREVNERISDITDHEELIEFLCECSDMECIEPVSMTRGDYERVRAESTWFFVVPGHVDRETSRRWSRSTHGSTIVQKHAGHARGGRDRDGPARLMLDERVLEVLARLEPRTRRSASAGSA